MPVNVQRGYMRMLRIAEHHVTVVGVEDRADWLKRVRLYAPDLAETLHGHPTEWIRLWVPDSGRDGLLRQRGYTVVASSPEGGWLDMDLVLHHPDGPASAWTRAVRVGSKAVVSFTPQKPHLGDRQPLTVLADTSSLPAVESLLKHLAARAPERTVRVFLDAQGHHVAALLGPHLARVQLTDDPVAEFSAMADSLGPDGVGFVWAGLSRQRVSALRTALRSAGIARGSQHVQAYWVEGKPFG